MMKEASMYVNGVPAKCIHINLLQLFKYLLLLSFAWLMSVDQYAQESIQLASPQTDSTAVYFKRSACVRFEFRQQGAVIRYSLNGNEPDEKSPIYKEPICLSASGIIKAKSFAPGFLPSPTIKVQCVKTNDNIESIEGSLPEEPYNKDGLKTLYDEKAGSSHTKDGWLGFRKDTLEWKIQLAKKQKAKNIHISLLQSQGSWIFYPAKIDLISFEGKILGKQLFNSDARPDEKNIFSFSINKKISGFIIRVKNFSSLPDWHTGKGNKPWLFIDEIAVE